MYPAYVLCLGIAKGIKLQQDDHVCLPPYVPSTTSGATRSNSLVRSVYHSAQTERVLERTGPMRGFAESERQPCARQRSSRRRRRPRPQRPRPRQGNLSHNGHAHGPWWTPTEPLYTAVAIFSAPAILSKFQKKSVQSWLEDVMKAAIGTLSLWPCNPQLHNYVLPYEHSLIN
jgi:hypothetical protein